MHKFSFCPRIKPPKSRTLFLDGLQTGIILSDFAQQLRRKNADNQDIYFSLLDAAGNSPTLILNQIAKAKEKEAGSPSKSERQKLQRLYTQGGPANGFVRNLVKACNLSVSKVRQFCTQNLPI